MNSGASDYSFLLFSAMFPWKHCSIVVAKFSQDRHSVNFPGGLFSCFGVSTLVLQGPFLFKMFKNVYFAQLRSWVTTLYRIFRKDFVVNST